MALGVRKGTELHSARLCGGSEQQLDALISTPVAPPGLSFAQEAAFRRTVQEYAAMETLPKPTDDDCALLRSKGEYAAVFSPSTRAARAAAAKQRR